MKYLYEYDDPYKLLASHIVGYYSVNEVMRVLYDDAFVLNRITKEVRNMDMRGYFVDCIIENILDDKCRMEYMHELDKLARYYFEKLDLARLRQNIVSHLEECGIPIPEDYADGKVSSETT